MTEWLWQERTKQNEVLVRKVVAPWYEVALLLLRIFSGDSPPHGLNRREQKGRKGVNVKSSFPSLSFRSVGSDGWYFSCFRPGAYDLFKHNCNNFSDEVCQFLCGHGIPKHILQLPDEVLNTWVSAVAYYLIPDWLTVPWKNIIYSSCMRPSSGQAVLFFWPSYINSFTTESSQSESSFTEQWNTVLGNVLNIIHCQILLIQYSRTFNVWILHEKLPCDYHE